MYEETLMKERAAYGGSIGIGGLGSQMNAVNLQAQQCAARSGEIPGSISNLMDRCEVLSKEVSTLEMRLTAILRQEPNKPTGPGQPPPFSATTPLGQGIAQASNMLESSIFRIRMLLDLLEL